MSFMDKIIARAGLSDIGTLVSGDISFAVGLLG